VKQKILLVLVLLFGAIQFVRPHPNTAAGLGPNDIAAKYQIPPDVQTVLQKACYDCHSNNTRYPWYAQVQPVGWWLANHISEGKRHLNFSEFLAYDAKRAPKKLKKAADELTEHDMPLTSYTLIHRDARLTPAETKLVADWADALAEQITPAKSR